MNDLVIVGCDVLGRHVLSGLRKQGKEPLAFAVTAPVSSMVDGLQVLSVEEAVIEFEDAVFIIALFQPSKMLDEVGRAGVCVVSFPEFARQHPYGLLPFSALALVNTLPKDKVSLFADEESRREYIGQCTWRTSLNASDLPPFHDIKDIYFPSDLVKLDNEVFLDCGAFDGDTIKQYRQHGGGRVIAIEPDPHNFDVLKKNYPDVSMYNFAVGEKREVVTFSAGNGASSSMGGNVLIQCVPIDELLQGEKVTFIKMDIEGAELAALKGARQTIVNNLPVLAICLYHKPDDIWEIPEYIHSLSDKYDLYLRRYAEDCWEEICYAIPKGKNESTH